MPERIAIISQINQITDSGTAPIIGGHGLARVDILGAITNFALFTVRTTIIDGQREDYREVICNVQIPTVAVGPAVDLTIETFGPQLLWPAATYVARRFLPRH